MYDIDYTPKTPPTPPTVPPWIWRPADIGILSQFENPTADNLCIIESIEGYDPDCTDPEINRTAEFTARYLAKSRGIYKPPPIGIIGLTDATPLAHFGQEFIRSGKLYFVQSNGQPNFALYPDDFPRPWQGDDRCRHLDIEAIRIIHNLGVK